MEKKDESNTQPTKKRPYNIEQGRLIERAMKTHHYSIGKLASDLNVTRGLVREYMKGRDLYYSDAKKIEMLLKINFDRSTQELESQTLLLQFDQPTRDTLDRLITRLLEVIRVNKKVTHR